MSRAYDDFRRLTCTTKIREEKDGWYSFEDTVFYGEKGGMPSDRGTINGQKVTDLRWEGDTLWHQTAEPLSDPIEMQVDEETRFLNTAIQSALHVLDGYYAKMGLKLISVGVHPGNQWYEVDSKNLPEGHLQEVERFMTQVILHSQKVSFSYMDGKDYPDPEYAKYGEVRIVKIGDLDTQPCGTPHVSETAEICSFTVLDSEKTSHGTKVHVSCGLDMNHRLHESYDTLKALNHVLNTGTAELVSGVENLAQTNRQMKKEIDELKNQLTSIKAAKLLESPDKVIVVEHVDSGELRKLSQGMMNQVKSLKILAAEIDGNSCFAIISPDNQARTLMDAVKQKLEVTGGGSPKIVSGQTAAPFSEVLDVLQQLG